MESERCARSEQGGQLARGTGCTNDREHLGLGVADRCDPGFLDPHRPTMVGLLTCVTLLVVGVLGLTAPPASAGPLAPSGWQIYGGHSLAGRILGGNVAGFSSAGPATFHGAGNLAPLTPATVATPEAGPVSLIISPDGTSVYAGFEHSGSVAQFSRDTRTGKLIPLSPATVEAGGEPRTLAISPDGENVYAANFASDTITTYSREPETGALTPIGSEVPTGPGPHGIEVSPDGNSVYVANYDERNTVSPSTVSQYSRNTTTGA